MIPTGGPTQGTLFALGNTRVKVDAFCNYVYTCRNDGTRTDCRTGRDTKMGEWCMSLDCTFKLTFSDRFEDPFDPVNSVDGVYDPPGTNPYDITGSISIDKGINRCQSIGPY